MSDFRDPEAESPGRMKSILVVTVAVAFAAAPFFAPFSGFDPNLFPIPQENPPSQPAGYAFAIWGVLYLWLLAHAFFGMGARADDPQWDAPRWPLFFALLLGTGWTAVASYSPIWATILAFLMLAGAQAAVHSSLSRYDRWLYRAPLALFAGWLTVASFAGLAIVGAGYHIGVGAMAWTVIALIGATTVAVWTQSRLEGTPEYAIAVIWGLVGVAVRNWSVNWGLVVLAMLASGVVAFTWHRSKR